MLISSSHSPPSPLGCQPARAAFRAGEAAAGGDTFLKCESRTQCPFKASPFTHTGPCSSVARTLFPVSEGLDPRVSLQPFCDWLCSLPEKPLLTRPSLNGRGAPMVPDRRLCPHTAGAESPLVVSGGNFQVQKLACASPSAGLCQVLPGLMRFFFYFHFHSYLSHPLSLP